MLTNARVATNLPLLGYTFLKYPYLGLNCKKEELATERRPRTSRSICHGLTRNFTEKTEAKTRKEDQEQAEAFATELHGKDTEGKCAGRRKTGPPHTRR